MADDVPTTQARPNPGRSSTGNSTRVSADPDEQLLDRLMALAEEEFDFTKEEWEKFREAMAEKIASGETAIEGAGTKLGSDLDLLDAGYRNKYGELFGHDIAAADMDLTYDSQAALAEGDPWALDQSRAALAEFGERAKGGLTPVEQLAMEIARRDQESQQRASRDAALRDMRARGFGGGGMEMAALLGTQQETGQRRALENMAQQANAQLRADRALEMQGTLGTKIDEQVFRQDFDKGGAADKASEFNNRIKLDSDIHRTNVALKNRDQIWGASGDVTNFGADKAKIKYDASIAAPVWGAETYGANLKMNPPSTQGQQGAAKTILGFRTAEQAAKMAEDDDNGIFGLGIGPL